MSYSIFFSPAAQTDLRSIYAYISARASHERALAYIQRIERYCRSFSDFPERGVRRDDLLPGLRVVGFERRVAVAFHIDLTAVIIDRILYGGRNLSRPDA